MGPDCAVVRSVKYSSVYTGEGALGPSGQFGQGKHSPALNTTRHQGSLEGFRYKQVVNLLCVALVVVCPAVSVGFAF
jgi:hypothetical protein